MTTTDEQLREMAIKLMRAGYIDNDVSVINAVTLALQQVRRDTVEECAKNLLNYIDESAVNMHNMSHEEL